MHPTLIRALADQSVRERCSSLDGVSRSLASLRAGGVTRLGRRGGFRLALPRVPWPAREQSS